MKWKSLSLSLSQLNLRLLWRMPKLQGHWLLEQQKLPSIKGIAASSGVAIGDLWWDNTQPELTDVYPASNAQR